MGKTSAPTPPPPPSPTEISEANVDTAFDEGLERLLKMAKIQKLKEEKA